MFSRRFHRTIDALSSSLSNGVHFYRSMVPLVSSSGIQSHSNLDRIEICFFFISGFFFLDVCLPFCSCSACVWFFVFLIYAIDVFLAEIDSSLLVLICLNQYYYEMSRLLNLPLQCHSIRFNCFFLPCFQFYKLNFVLVCVVAFTVMNSVDIVPLFFSFAVQVCC